jgi:hypothetical protein
MKMQQKNIDELKNKIIKSGFPTELEIGKIFAKNGWEVEHNTYFIDKDENKGREIDLIAEYMLQNNIPSHYTEFTFRFVVEIKREIEKPWVIFTTQTSDFEQSIYGYGSEVLHHNFDTTKLFDSIRMHNQPLANRLGRSFTEGFSQGKDKIYSSLCNTSKAFVSSIESTSKDKSTDSILTYIEPLVVINGSLFEAYLNDKYELDVQQTNSLQFRFNYISEHYPKRTIGYIMNIVTKNYLSDYIKLRSRQFVKIFEENKEGILPQKQKRT